MHDWVGYLKNGFHPGTEPELKVRGGSFTVSCVQWFRFSTSLLLSHITVSCLNFFKVSDCLF